MKRNELKKVLKPLIRECIKEVIFEEGVLSTLISETISGVTQGGVISESKLPSRTTSSQISAKNEQAKKRLLDAIGRESYKNVNIFEGTDPMPSESAGHRSALSGVAPNDPGVDITMIPGMNKWGLLAK